MIEKLPFAEIHSGGEDMVDRVEFKPVSSCETQHKINELVDAVNELQKQIDKMSCAILDLATPNGENKALESIKAESKTPIDPYAEQRKWIGKLCWFWDIQEEYKFVGILREVADNGTYFQKDGIVSYLNCEPVKPDEDIIYKGE